ncbi:MAG: hypothetical protein B6D39_11095 [Anaerolineae bacterium UTCFX2]|jgi:DNA-binding response OmpR family regulator|nr:response regulator [Anaerolineales bacterium]OQY88823.1 MAG: hypothetical protein B6D39_11095 [Anaerolineae bacterium UTCFX2]
MNDPNTESPIRIVIVDDHPNTATMLARVLTKFETPVEVFTALNAKEAIHQIDERGIDILITDFMMPEINGLELIEKLDGAKRPAHIILITAYDTPGLAVAARQLNVKDYLVKPVQPERIREIVRCVIEELRPPATNLTEPDCKHVFKILVADDNPDNLKLLRTRLVSEGYEFFPAWDGEETLNIARAELPDLVLLDVSMPKKDGFQVLREFREDLNLKHIPVIIVTAARIGSKDIRDGLLLGADDYVIKPFDWRELAARIHSKLRVKQAEDALRCKNMELAIFPKLSQDLRGQNSIESIASALANHLADGLGVQNVWLEINLSDGSQIWCSNPSALSPEALAADPHIGMMIHDAQETAYSSGSSVLLQDSRSIPELDADLGGESFSAAFVPVIGLNKTWGVLSVIERRSNFFKKEHLEIVEALGFMAALAIENSKFDPNGQTPNGSKG